MNVQWIFLALFLVAIISNVFKAMRNPMLKNVLNLISVVVAFIITFVLQVCGVFQSGIEYLVETLELAAMVPEFEGLIANAISFLLPFCTTLLGPLVFSLAFGIILFLLKIIHVNLIYMFIRSRQRKKEIKEFRLALKEENRRVKESVHASEERIYAAVDGIEGLEPDSPVYEYEPLSDDEIERMVAEKIKADKKKRKKEGFFKESGENKAISIIAGVVCGFLLFGISWMGLFYTMDVLSDVTAGIDDINADDNKIYKAVAFVDNHLVTPYEESFVYKLYDSMAMVDLLNYTVRAGGKLEVNGEVIYADDVMRDHTMRVIRLACELTSAKDSVYVSEDISSLTKDPMTVSILADLLVMLMEKVEVEEPAPDQSNPLNGVLTGVLGAYKGENNREIFIQDMGAISDMIVVGAENKLLAKIIAGESFESFLGDRVLLKDMISAMSGLSVYGSTMQGIFELSIDMIAPKLNLPEDKGVAYESVIGQIVKATSAVQTMTPEELANFYLFMEKAADFVSEHENNTATGFLAYIADPLYGAEKLKDEGKTYQDLADQYQTQADDLIARGDDLKTRGEDAKARGDILLAQSNEIQAEIDALISNPGAYTPEEYLAIKADLEARKDALVADGEALKLEGEALKLEGEALKQEAEELKVNVEQLKDDVQALVDNAKAYIEDFQARVEEFKPFISYFMNWMNIQKTFMLAGEDKTSGCLAIMIGDKLYMCNTDDLSLEDLLDLALDSDFGNLDLGLGDEDADLGEEGGEGEEEDNATEFLDATVDEYLAKLPESLKNLLEKMYITANTDEVGSGRISPFTSLINYLIVSANADKTAGSATIDKEWLYTHFESYCNETDANEASYIFAKHVCDVKDYSYNFNYKGVIVEDMRASLNFGEEWDAEAKKKDSEQLVEIIFAMLDLVENMGIGEAEQMNSISDSLGNMDMSEIESILDLFVTLGKVLDNMSNTTCLHKLPAVMIKGIMTNDKLSAVMIPTMFSEYMLQLEEIENNPDDDQNNYTAFMENFVGDIKGLLEKVENKEEQ